MPYDDWSTINKLATEVDKLTRIAYIAMAALEKKDPNLSGMNKEATKWYANHKAEIEKRKLAEDKEKAKRLEQLKLRQEALAKLTPEEIEAFGIKVR